jgi:short-subunit dehydrogenase
VPPLRGYPFLGLRFHGLKPVAKVVSPLRGWYGRTMKDKVIIITGASSGIGRATALALARENARLVLVARRENLLRTLAEETGGISMVLDLRQKDQVEAMIRRTKEEFGRIDVLINNAGFGFYGSVENTPASVVREIFDLNFDAPLLASQLVIPIMRAQGGGHIINVSSVVGKRALPLSGIYCATKFALQGISESLRVEVKDAGIEVSIISPAATLTEFGDSVRRGDVTQKFKPAGRVQSAEEVASSIVRCIENPKAEVYPNRASRLLVWANAISPSLVDKIMVRFLRGRLSPKVSTNS